MISDKVLYLYLRDPKNKHRVMTVARILVKTDSGDFLQVATATNRVSLSHFEPWFKQVQKPVDVFNKKMGRKIAAGRLASEHSYRVYLEGRTPSQALRDFLTAVPPSKPAYRSGRVVWERNRKNFLPELESRIARGALKVYTVDTETWVGPTGAEVRAYIVEK